jgi:alanyl-tRNA synthetase
METISSLEKEASRERLGKLDDVARDLLAKSTVLPGAGNRKLVVSRQDGMEMNDMRRLGDRLRDGGVTAAIIGSVGEGRCTILVMVEPGAAAAGVDAVAIVKKGAALVGGSGGGKSHLAQAGGRNPEGLDRALSSSEEEARALLRRVYGA